ncbi:uncharacterized protein LOC140702201 isoform X3 [Pogona vitticeps]
MLKAGGAGFFFPAVSPQFLPHLPLQHPESVPFARRWETLACTERLDARGRRLGVVLSMNSFTRMQSFIVRLRHLQTRGTTGSRKVGGTWRAVSSLPPSSGSSPEVEIPEDFHLPFFPAKDKRKCSSGLSAVTVFFVFHITHICCTAKARSLWAASV